MELINYTLRSISSAIISPPLVFILVILMFVFYFKNKKIQTMQSIIIGGKGESALELTLSQFVFGIMGGTVGSIILTELGVRFNYESGIQLLFFVSILLMFVKPKYICFSYSAGILGIINILIETLSSVLPETINEELFEINIVYLLLFVGILHIVEGILVMLDGNRGAIPVFKESENKIIGGYTFKRYWLLPIAMIFINMAPEIYNSVELYIDTPHWWQLINNTGLAAIGIVAIMPFYAVIGYSSVTFTKTKRKKALVSGCYISFYGICVVMVAQVARLGIAGELFAVIFTPVAHEFMIRIQRKAEKTNNPLFLSDDGLIILDISRDSQMNKYGLEIGDKVLAINGDNVDSEKEIYKILKKSLYRVNIKIKKKNGEIKEFMHIHDKTKRLGILLVPRKILKDETTEIKENSFQAILEEVKRVNEFSKSS